MAAYPISAIWASHKGVKGAHPKIVKALVNAVSHGIVNRQVRKEITGMVRQSIRTSIKK
ncbi:MAG: hypothetical protein V1835_03275 [Candidatus Micrarchaeota archaeon]